MNNSEVTQAKLRLIAERFVFGFLLKIIESNPQFAGGKKIVTQNTNVEPEYAAVSKKYNEKQILFKDKKCLDFKYASFHFIYIYKIH